MGTCHRYPRKIRYRNRESAVGALIGILERTPRRGLAVFDCHSCGGCHIGGGKRERPYKRKGRRVGPC